VPGRVSVPAILVLVLELQLAAGLPALTVLKELPALAGLTLIAGDTQLPAVVWSSLAGLTWLTHLSIKCAAPSGQHLLSLTSCQRLDSLYIPEYYSGEFAPGFDEELGIDLQVSMGFVLGTHSAASLISSR